MTSTRPRQLSANARVVDLVEENFDVGIRAGSLADSSLIAKSLGMFARILVATPTYLKRRGRPKSPIDLKKHDCLLFGSNATLTLTRDTRREDISVNPRLLVTDMDVLESAVKDDLGIAVMPAFMCNKAIRAARLERVLPAWSPPPTPLHIVYPSTRHLSPTVRSFIEFVQERIRNRVEGGCPPKS